ncbi:MAG: hypothetical protein ACLRSD_08240 [Oscillibacter sp.]
MLIGVGKLNAGTAYNAVAETAVLEGTTRMFSPESRAHLRETINAAAAHISALYGGTAEVEWDDFATPLTNDAGVCGEVERVADVLGIPATANRALSLSGDDFAGVSAANEGRLRLPRHGKPQKAATPASPTTAAISTSTRKRSPSARRSTRHTRCPSLIRSLPNNCFFR